MEEKVDVGLNGSKRRLLVVVVAAALLAAGTAVIVASGQGDESQPRPGFARGGAIGASLFTGIPQKGTLLGSGAAKVKVVEFGDLQCPVCRDFDLDVLPTFVEKYVRPGRASLEFRPIASVGSESAIAAAAAYSAAEQNEFWPFVSSFYANQQKENTGYVTGAFLRGIAGGVRGLEVRQWEKSLNRSVKSYVARVARSEEEAIRRQIPGTPTFFVSVGGGKGLQPLELRSLTPEGFTEALSAVG